MRAGAHRMVTCYADDLIPRAMLFGTASIVAGSLSYHARPAPFFCDEQLPNSGLEQTVELDSSNTHCEEQDEDLQFAEMERDSLFHERQVVVHLPQSAVQVLPVAADIARWADFMPCCSQSKFIRISREGHELFQVNFGVSLGFRFIGDKVIYEVSQPERGLLLLRSVNNESLTYVDRIAYFVAVSDTLEGSKLTVHLAFHARNQLYLHVWKQIERPMIDLLANSLKTRAATLMADQIGEPIVSAAMNS